MSFSAASSPFSNSASSSASAVFACLAFDAAGFDADVPLAKKLSSFLGSFRTVVTVTSSSPSPSPSAPAPPSLFLFRPRWGFSVGFAGSPNKVDCLLLVADVVADEELEDEPAMAAAPLEASTRSKNDPVFFKLLLPL